MNFAMYRALDENPPAPLCWSLSHWPKFGAATDTLMTPDSEPKEGVRASTGGPLVTKTCPDLDGGTQSAVIGGASPASEQPPVNGGHDPLTKACPNTGANAQPAVPGLKSPYRFDDSDRARSLTTRRQRQFVDTALTCNSCHAQTTCPAFQAGSVCTIVDTFKSFESKAVDGVIAKLKEIIAALETRAWQNAYFEQLDGGGAKKEVTAMFGKLMEYHKLLFDLYNELDLRKNIVVLDPESTLGRIFGPQAARDASLPDSGDQSTL